MNRLIKIIDDLPLLLVIAVCVTLGLAPFVPQPHVWEKLSMLLSGRLVRPVDMFDFLLHGMPWLLLLLKLAISLNRRGSSR